MAEKAQILSWGKCSIVITPIAGSGASGTEAVTLETPKEDSTQLTPTQGDKKEATVEGGDVVATRTNAAKYTLTTRIRLHSGQKTAPLGDGNGQIPGEFSVSVTPTENTAAPKITIPRTSVSCMYNYNAADGIEVQYDFDVLKPETGAKIQIS